MKKKSERYILVSKQDLAAKDQDLRVTLSNR